MRRPYDALAGNWYPSALNEPSTKCEGEFSGRYVIPLSESVPAVYRTVDESAPGLIVINLLKNIKI